MQRGNNKNKKMFDIISETCYYIKVNSYKTVNEMNLEN